MLETERFGDLEGSCCADTSCSVHKCWGWRLLLSASTTPKPQSAGATPKPQSAGATLKLQSASAALKPQSASTALKPQSASTALKPQSASIAFKPTRCLFAFRFLTLKPETFAESLGSKISLQKVTQAAPTKLKKQKERKGEGRFLCRAVSCIEPGSRALSPVELSYPILPYLAESLSSG